MVQIRGYKKGDEKGIFNLWKKIFGDLEKENDIFKINEKWWSWRVLRSPYEFPKFYLAFSDKNEVVASHIAEKFSLSSKKGKKTIYQGIISMADEKYRGLTSLKLRSEEHTS